MEMTYKIHFNLKYSYSSSRGADGSENDAEGPIVECWCCLQCQNDKISYATLQLRSTDEGQTAFYVLNTSMFRITIFIIDFILWTLLSRFANFALLNTFCWLMNNLICRYKETENS